MNGFGRFLAGRGYEFRVDRFALFQNIYEPGAATHLDVEIGRTLFDDFFRFGCEDIDPAPGASESLRRLAAGAGVVILTNAPDYARAARARWLARHGMDYPLIINAGLKGEAVATLAERTSGPVAFIDDLIPNLNSVEAAAPAVRRFQMVADPRLRLLAPCEPERHTRIDEWPDLHSALALALGLEQP
ncbi:MAG TPA: hypothetical protein VHY34_03745 [Caulobacteraceae bacterium]|nr:hypothetical protein [Caulobacteraceae bacterium]